MVQKHVYILGVPVDNLSSTEIQQRLVDILVYRRQRQIVTPNPEFVLEAQHNPEFLLVLREAQLAIPDGFGLTIAAWLKGIHLRRFPGANLVMWLLRYSDKRHLKVAIINRQDGLSLNEEIVTALKQRYPGLALHIQAVDKTKPQVALGELNRFQPQLLFCTLGAPEQDILLSRIIKKIPSLRLGIGVGGSFDYLTGKRSRAPRFLQRLGLEWLWRLLIQPTRVKRIWRAVVVFLATVVQWELRRFRFRPNVVVMILNDENEVLILNARGRGSYWGLPQGGREKGESLEAAMRREVFEETGIRDLELVTYFKDIYRYTWSKSYPYKGYKGQRQSLGIARYHGPRDVVKTNPFEHKDYQWVKVSELVKKSSPVHKKQYELFLKKYRAYYEKTT